MTKVHSPRRLTVKGVSLAYEEAGAGRALVCVHGNFASRRWFTDVLARPPGGWRVLALDLPNFGASDPMPGPISIGAYARYLQGFVDALGLARPVLLGHSLGGAVVQVLAARSSRLAAGLVLVASAPPNGIVTPSERYAMLPLLRGNPQLMRQALAATMPTRTPPYFEALVKDALAMGSAAFTDNARALERYDVSGSLGGVLAPVLAVGGDRDYLIAAAMVRATAAAFAAGSSLLLPNVGHSPQIEAPEVFGRAIETFLKGVP